MDTSNTMTFARAASPLDAILGKSFPVLDHGFVRVVDYMGNDSSIVQMARVSYGEGTKAPSDDRSLIRYLMRHDHTSPFEGCEIKLHVKLPIFVARQWIRHRTVNVNEVSGRYSILKDEFYMPAAERLGRQSVTNKQGTGEGYAGAEAASLLNWMESSAKESFETYGDLTGEAADLSRELARIVLPLSTYPEWYWKIDLHNLFHFMRLRADSHAQQEIRDYAVVLEHIANTWVPNAYEAYVDYRRDAVKFSRVEMELLRHWAALSGSVPKLEWMSDREHAELVAKLKG